MLAGVLGTVHAGFSLYWGAGGDWLVGTLGRRMVDAFAGWEWVLVPIGLVKLVAAWVPVAAARGGWPARRLLRTTCWAGVAVLVLWGGANTVVGNLVLRGVIVPDGPVDRIGMAGHAYLWDPMFLAWGLALAVGLRQGRPRRPTGRSSTEDRTAAVRRSAGESGGRTAAVPSGLCGARGTIGAVDPVEVTALAINVAVPDGLRWRDTRRDVEFELQTLTIRLLPDGSTAAKAYGRPVAGGRGGYVSFPVPDRPELVALVAAAADEAGRRWSAHL